MIDKLGSMKIDQLSKYVSPQLGEGTSKKSGLGRIQKMTSNLVQQITVKLRRIETFIKSGEWINDNKVAGELNKRIVDVTGLITDLEDENETKKILKELFKINMVASKFIERKKLSDVQSALIEHLSSLVQTVRARSYEAHNKEVVFKESDRSKPKELHSGSDKNVKRDLAEKMFRVPPPSQSQITGGISDIDLAETTKAEKPKDIGKLQKKLAGKKVEFQENLIKLSNEAFGTSDWVKNEKLINYQTPEQREKVSEMEDQSIASMGYKKIKDSHDQLLSYIDQAYKKAPKAEEKPPVPKEIRNLMKQLEKDLNIIKHLENQINSDENAKPKHAEAVMAKKRSQGAQPKTKASSSEEPESEYPSKLYDVYTPPKQDKLPEFRGNPSAGKFTGKK